jgi:hypothetical protein
MAEAFLEANDTQIRDLSDKFTGYTVQIDHLSIRRWLRQFDLNDMYLGLKLLEYIDYHNPAQLIDECKLLQNQINALPGGFNLVTSYFAGFSRAGHSSGILLERYRLANNFASPRYDAHFIYLSALNLFFDKKDAKFFFIEDFAGTGDSTIEIWNEIRDFIPNPDNVYLLLCAVDDQARQRITIETPLKIIPNKILFNTYRIFSPQNIFFTEDEKNKLRVYCERAGSEPLGYGNNQSNVVFFYRAPNNIISILRSNNNNWKGLFVRFL